MGPGRASTAQRHVRFCDLGQPRTDADHCARSLRREAGLLRRGRRRACCSPPKSRLSAPIRRSARGSMSRGLAEYLTFQNFFTDRTLVRRRAAVARGLLHCRSRSVPTDRSKVQRYGISISRSRRAARRGGSTRGTRSPVPPGGQSSARQRRRHRLLSLRRHGFRLDHRACGRAIALHANLYRRVRSELGLRRRTWLRRALQGRAHVVPVQDRALRDGAQGRRHGALPAAAWPGIWRSRGSASAIRTSMPPSSPRSSSRWCCPEPAATSCSRGYPWRYYRAVVNDDFDHYVRQVLWLLAAAGAERTRCRR